MKTIKERAKDYASKKADISSCAIYNDALASIYMEGYIAGATEQKAIDEEVRLKKCDDMTEAEYNHETAFMDWYLENGKGTPTYSDAIEWARKDLLDKVCEWLEGYCREIGYEYDCMFDDIVVDGPNRLRKAMEE